VGERLADADQLTDADREQVTAAARQALTTFLAPAPEQPLTGTDHGSEPGQRE